MVKRPGRIGEMLNISVYIDNTLSKNPIQEKKSLLPKKKNSSSNIWKDVIHIFPRSAIMLKDEVSQQNSNHICL